MTDCTECGAPDDGTCRAPLDEYCPFDPATPGPSYEQTIARLTRENEQMRQALTAIAEHKSYRRPDVPWVHWSEMARRALKAVRAPGEEPRA